MIPVKLQIEGLYSYQESQTIDFSILTDAGLFGIFGKVGSGKSSILEAITFALYGETERMNAREKRAYNMMNLESNRLYIAFDFKNYDNKLFRAVREFKRNSKRFEDVKLHRSTFYENVANQWIPLEHTQAEKILNGLSYENFKRSIIIPQGQFKEFLELGATDRTKMMKEIFGLHRFDLQDKTSQLRNKCQWALEHLHGQLKVYENVNTELLLHKEEELARLTEQFDFLSKEYRTTEDNFKRLNLLKTDFENLQLRKQHFEKLQEQWSQINQKEEDLLKFEQIATTFTPLFTEQKKINERKAKDGSQMDNYIKELVQLNTQLNTVTENISKLKPDFDLLPERRIQESDLEHIIIHLRLSHDIKILKERSQKGQDFIKQKEESELNLQNLIQAAVVEREGLTPLLIPAETIAAAESWIKEEQLLKQQLELQTQKIATLTQKINLKKEQISEKDIHEVEDNFEKKSAALKDERVHLDFQKTQLEVQQKLSQYAVDLQEGKACSLCGSEHHPKPASPLNVRDKLMGISKAIDKNEVLKEQAQKERNHKLSLFSDLDHTEKLLLDEKNVLADTNHRINAHLGAFKWPNYNKETHLNAERKIQKIDLSLVEQRKSLENTQKDLKKYRIILSEFIQKEADLNGQLSQNRSQIKVLNVEKFLERMLLSEIQTELEQLKVNNEVLERQYHLLIEQQNGLNLKKAGWQASVDQLKKQIEQIEIEEKGVQDKLTEALAALNLSGLEEVRQTLGLQYDVPVVRKEIESFRINFQTAKIGLQELEGRLKDQTFNSEDFKAVEEKFKLISTQRDAKYTEKIKAQQSWEQLSNSLKQKESLLTHKQQLDARMANLELLFNLFKGQGFVQYVSSVYLQQLCQQANLRFQRMTRHQLSLDLSDNLDFEVIDHLNGGRNRSVKTLSGGQAFQASLSLALALAESVQSDAKAEKKFFFIDEGFGTQDSDSIQVVFETLMNLRKENRIVGIISHVEELKEKLPVALQITESKEKGSRVEIIYG